MTSDAIVSEHDKSFQSPGEHQNMTTCCEREDHDDLSDQGVPLGLKHSLRDRRESKKQQKSKKRFKTLLPAKR